MWLKTILVSLSTILCSQMLMAQLSDIEVESKIDSIIPLLTLEEKVAMCHAQSKFSSPGVPRLGIPEIWMSDGPHGVRGEINWDNWGYANWTNDYITAFPALTGLAATFNPELSYEYGIALGEEARYREKDILLGPGVNIYRTPLNGRNFEYMGEDPHLASTLVAPYIQGVQKNGVAACVKHYALNNQEAWRNHINVKVSDRALHEIYLPAFKSAIQDGKAWSLMGAYNQYNDQYTSHHKYLINQVLKKEWGYDGIVITDWGSAHNTLEAALNGLDIEMGTRTNGFSFSEKNAYDNYFLAIPFLKELKEGTIEESVVDDKVRRILRLMYRTNMKQNRPLGRINNKEHIETARTVGQEAIVLLKNEKQFFPISPDKNITIAVIGENATRQMTVGGGSSELKALKEYSPLEGIQERYKNATILHTMGYASGKPMWKKIDPSPYDADSLRLKALEIAKQADVVLFIGGLNKNYRQDCEGGDRLQYGLPFNQEELIEEISSINPNLGLVLVSGNAVEMPWISKVKGVLQAWYLGSEAGHALADIISGDVNPSGKLPFSFPAKLEDCSAHAFGEIAYPGDSLIVEYKEDILVGYRWHDTKKIQPQFAFGHGLSYSTFEISDVQSNKKTYSSKDTIKITSTVSNTGNFDGAEVVQVYIGKPKSKIDRPLKELKGFQKASISKKNKEAVTIAIPVSNLNYYDTAASNWNLEEGEYIIYVGNASDNINKEIKVKITK